MSKLTLVCCIFIVGFWLLVLFARWLISHYGHLIINVGDDYIYKDPYNPFEWDVKLVKIMEIKHDEKSEVWVKYRYYTIDENDVIEYGMTSSDKLVDFLLLFEKK
jgi:hypothetical protein